MHRELPVEGFLTTLNREQMEERTQNTKKTIRLDQKLFRWYGLTTLGIQLIVSIILLVILSMVITQRINSSLKANTREIQELVSTWVEIEVEHRLENHIHGINHILSNIRSRSDLTDEQAKAEAARIIRSYTIGLEGYCYVLNSGAEILIHKYRELEGTNVGAEEFVQQQIKQKQGFLAYYWQNPGEEAPRYKVLDMTYIPEWDWIITVTAYPDDFPNLIDRDNLSRIMAFLTEDTRQRISIMDSKGYMLVHPGISNITSIEEAEPDFTNIILQQINSKPSGHIHYVTTDGSRKLRLLYFAHIPNIKLTATASVLMEDIQQPIWRLSLLLVLLLAATSTVFLILSARFSRTVQGSLNKVIKSLDRTMKGNYTREKWNSDLKEIQVLGRHFNHFLEKLEQGELTQKTLGTLQLLSDTVFDNTLEGIAIADLKGNITLVNEAFTQITGYAKNEVLGENPRILRSEHHDKEFYEEMWNLILTEGSWSGEIWNRHKDGHTYPEWLTITTLKNKQGEPEQYISIFHDISDLKQNEARLHRMAYHDAMTDLPNRELFTDRLKLALASSHRNNTKGAVLFMDLDNFKQINDSLGHSVGDIYLQEIANRLSAAVREDDTVARMGGDEFTILLPVISDQADAMEAVKRVQRALEEPVFFNKKVIYPRASFGVTFFPEDGTSPSKLMQNADMAMYKSKKKQDGKITVFNQKLEKINNRLNVLEERLRKAVVDRHLQVFYQPQYSLKDRRFSGVEALIRWKDPEEGWIAPGEFIPVAERCGLISAIDTWVLRNSLKEIGQLNKTLEHPLTLGINVSAVQFSQESFIESVAAAVKKENFPPDLLELEITESTAMENVDAAIEKIQQLADLGFHRAIDDFGTGYSSLSYLNRFNIDTLKIDRSFIMDLNKSAEAEAIVTSVIGLGNSLSFKVIAEGVETEEQLRFLEKDSSPIIQGYYFAKPMPLSDLTGFLKGVAKK